MSLELSLRRLTGLVVFISIVIVVGVVYDNTVIHMLRVNFSSCTISDIPIMFAMLFPMVVPLGFMISHVFGSLLWLSVELMKDDP